MTGIAAHTSTGAAPLLPKRTWWTLVIGFDLVLLALLQYVDWVAVAAAAIGLAIWVVRKPHRALAFAVLGQPLIWTAGYLSGIDPGRLMVEQLLVLIPLGCRAWNSVWQWPAGTQESPSQISQPVKVAFLCTGILAVSLVIASLWSPSPSYGRMKAILFVLHNVVLMVGAYLLLRQGEEGETFERRGFLFIQQLVPLAVILALAAYGNLLWQFFEVGDRLTVMDLNPIWFARYLGLGMFATSALLVRGRISPLRAGIVFAILLPAFYLAGSRGPLLGILTAGSFYFFARKGGSTMLRRALLFVVPWVGVAVIGVLMLGGGVESLSPFGASHSASNVARAMMLSIAMDAIGQPGLWGLGTGAFSSLMGFGDIRFYPHNLLIELWLENGAVGLLAFLGFSAATFRVWRRFRNAGLGSEDAAELVRFAAAFFVFSWVNAQFSGDLPVNEGVFFSAGALFAWAESSE